MFCLSRIYSCFYIRKCVFLNRPVTIKKSFPYLAYALILFKFSYGQDIHFSQFNGSLLNLTPGFTGLFNGDFRVGAIYRSQWQTVPVKYSTVSLGGEARVKLQPLDRDMVGVGLLFNSDRAGDARYGTTQLYANGNYIHLAKADSSLLVTFGMNLGWCQAGFDYTKMTFDNQYDGLQYNQGLATGEHFELTRYNYADINLGSAVQYILNSKHRFTYGLGLYHINSPVISYQGTKNSRLDFKWGNYLGYSTPLSLKTDVIAEALINVQGKNYELIPHASLKYYMNRDLNQAVLGGLCFRARDAVIVRLGYHYRTLQSGMAYDINISRFYAATNRRGGFEIFVNYIIQRRYSYVAKKRACPVFM